MTAGHVLLLASVLLQLAATVLALRLIGASGRRLAWILLALALVVMAAKRLLVLGQQLADPARAPPDVAGELTALLIAAAGLAALARIRPYFLEMRAQAEALERSEARFRRAFDDAPIGMALVSLDGRLLQVNHALCRILGYGREQLLSKTVPDITHPDDLEVENVYRQQAQDGTIEGFEVEKRYLHRDGHVVWARLSVSLVRDAAGAPLHYIGQLEDVSERHRSEAEVRRTRDHLRALYDASPDMIFVLTAGGRLLDVNDNAVRILGFARDEFLRGDPRRGLPAGAEFGTLLAHIEEAAGGGEPEFEWTARRKDGEEFPVEVRLRRVVGAPGPGEDAPRVLAVVRDVSQRKEALRARDRERALLSRILDRLPLNVFLKDPEGRYALLNRSALAAMAREREQAIGRTDLELFPEAMARRLQEGDEEALRADEPVVREETIVIGGEERRLLACKTALRLADSERPHILGFSLDITDRKQAEDALRQSETRFRELVEHMSSGVVVYQATPDGEDFVIHDFNRAAERIEGVRRTDVMGRPVTAAFPGVEAFGLLDVFRRVSRTGRPERHPAALYRDERIEGWRENYVFRVPSGEVVAVYDDVTERRRLEQELQHAQRMEAVGRLAGGVAHDFNNLLQVVLGITQLLRASSRHERSVVARLDELEHQVRRGVSLTRQLLLFSRNEPPQSEPLDLNAIVDRTARLLERLLKENVTLDVAPAAELLPVRADAAQMEQVLMNLAVNAADAMPEGGRLRIRSGAEGRDRVWITVEDTGKGVPPSMRRQVFEPFFTTKGPAKGTGLGLSVAQGIVSRHGGSIEVSDARGGGALFRVRLPRLAEESVGEGLAAREPAVDAPRGRGERVLLVEDEEAARRALAEMLVLLGYEVTSSPSAEQALDLAARSAFDLLLTDVLLPDVSGADLARRLKERSPLVAVVFMSGYTEEDVLDAEVARGGSGFLSKPFGIRELAYAVRQALDAAPRPRAARE